ncbi:MAG TPA: alkaline phosphatase family protein [Streptosporangiaceae bacterium]|nr:alkaline phosphatase family protein [Streptosporangiaceae bacterium]
MTSLITRCFAMLSGGATVLALGSAVTGPASAATRPRTAQIPVYSHIVVLIEENHSYSQIIRNPAAPYINSLAGRGALFTDSFGITYPSEPNYLALFAGSTFGLTTDSCPHSFAAANLGSELTAAGLSYSGYSEAMPSQGYEGCFKGEYARKHNPAPDFSNLPHSDNKTFAEFPSCYGSLPTVSFVDPDLIDDMHSASVAMGDTWLKDNIGGYVTWATAHNSLLILTWDTDNKAAGNHIATIFAGAHIKPGRYSEKINHYNVLRTIEQAYRLPYAGASATATPITDVFGG